MRVTADTIHMGYTRGPCAVITVPIQPLANHLAQVFNASHDCTALLLQRHRNDIMAMLASLEAEYVLDNNGQMVIVDVFRLAPAVKKGNNSKEEIELASFIGMYSFCCM